MIFYSAHVHASHDQASYGDLLTHESECQHHRPSTHNALQCLYLQTYLPPQCPTGPRPTPQPSENDANKEIRENDSKSESSTAAVIKSKILQRLFKFVNLRKDIF